MASDEKALFQADGMMLDGKYAEAAAIIRKLITITPETTEFETEDFNMQKLLLYRIQRIYKASGNGSPAPLEKLIKYYEIVARNHPGEKIQLSAQEAQICGLVLDWLPPIGQDGKAAPADEARAKQLVDGIVCLLGENKDKYKLGVFYAKGF